MSASNYSRKITNRAGVVLGLLVVFLLPTSAIAKIDAAQCAALPKSTQAVCTAHKMCSLVLTQHKNCDKAGTFLGRLKTITAGRRSINSNDVFEAALPPVTGDPEFSKISKSLRAAYLKQKGIRLTSGTTEKGAYWVYEGPMLNGKKHGIGIMANSGGLFFRGTFTSENQKGRGEDRNVVTDERYAGEMIGGLASGSGILRKENGNRYVGSFRKDKKHGRGIYTWPSGDRYEGSFSNNNRSGQGVYTWADGSRFEGEYRDNKRYNGVERHVNGKVIVYADGASKTGNANTPSPQQAAQEREQAARRKKELQETLQAIRPTVEATGNAETNAMFGLLQTFAGGSSDSSSGGGASGGGTITESNGYVNVVTDCSFEGYDKAIAAFTRAKPQQPGWGARDTYQYSYYFGSEGLKILEQYKSCMNSDQYRDNHSVLVGARDKGLEGCQKLSSDGGASCRPVYPGSSGQNSVSSTSANRSPGEYGTGNSRGTYRNRCGGTIPLPANYRCMGEGGGYGTAR